FSLILLCPPCSTLFPYTTLFRSRLESNHWAPRVAWGCLTGNTGSLPCKPAVFHSPSPRTVSASRQPPLRISRRPLRKSFAPLSRSEEHTSELQSRSDLVCRLLLE